MAERPALVLRRVTVRAASLAEGQAAAAALRAGLAAPLVSAPAWHCGSVARLALTAPANRAGTAAASAVRGALGEGSRG